ncbi:hypothetical protein CEUSTIGMA_g701.t1 [Chlamydomonas eustigma]|uniref:peptidyl-tRNA hydrolase n=1 Tax=Chlamydomonas eustigma TaxID=1157962 RepID=A0A250WQY2_9CHLO|nr:hypothetical protein CEUSTIGMA_g701.t1 [Chlamydomonas eustigma]|eukprot:GAX73247.1 hypothetical protein CEUSTIGMA_g701.t1 [Chlamydomonas eustigma]
MRQMQTVNSLKLRISRQLLRPSMTSQKVHSVALESTEPSTSSLLVQYVVLRKDLWAEQVWPLGSVVAQACHASLAAMWLYKDDESTLAYCAPNNIDNMHKVVLEVKGEVQLSNLSTKLLEAGVKHKLWIEQPEGFPTCLATKPYPKDEIASHFKKLNLCKAALT